MENILSALERLADLSDDELSSLKADIASTFKDTDREATPTAEAVEALTALADANDAVKAEMARRETEVAELSAAREAAVSRLTEAEAATEEPEVEDDPDQVDEEEEEVFSAKEPEASVVETETAALAVEAVEPEATPVEAELAVEEAVVETPAPEAELAVETVEEIAPEAELSVEVVEETAPVAELAVEEAAVETPAEKAELSVEDAVVEETAPAIEEAELAAEDVAIEETEAVTAAAKDEPREDSENTVTAVNSKELDVPADRLPVQKSEPARVPVTIRAAANLGNVAAGSEMTSLKEISEAINERIRTRGADTPSSDGERLPVATFSAAYPTDRYLSDDKRVNSELIQSVMDPVAITAAGGICAPVNVRYDVFSFNEETGRPVRDALVSFAADRGGVRFVTPPVLTDLDGAVSLWTLADDESATDGTPTKDKLRVSCGDEVVVQSDAIPLILVFGNMGARAYPELIARHTALGMVWHARYAETRLLTRIGSLSTAVTSTQELGAVRDILVAVDQAAAGYRNRHRLAGNSPLRVLLPEWVRNALRSDLVKQAPGDGLDAALNLADATIEGFFSARSVKVSWFLDGETGQIMGEQTTGALNSYPANLVWYMFSEGTFLFLDGGTLDLGVVRDSTLNSTNDYELFFETFEGVAKVGIESLRITTPVGIFGGYAAAVDTIA